MNDFSIGKVTCKQCILHSNIPGVTINEAGLCNSCADLHDKSRMEQITSQLFSNKLAGVIEQAKQNKRAFEAMVLFSGGKDSTHLLKVVRDEYQLKTLASSIIHPLVNDVASGNMDQIAKKMGVHLIKSYPEERIYKKVMRFGLLNGHQYGLDEFAGCSLCSFMFKWLSLKMAWYLNIPLVFDGADIAQSDGPYFLDGSKIKQDLLEGRSPFGMVHAVVKDALGDEFEGSIYDYNPTELKVKDFPSVIAPFTFTKYNYQENFKEIEGLGLDARKFRKLFTNCDAIPFFSYFSLQRYDCVPYVKHYASEIRRGYSNLLQLKLTEVAPDSGLTKEMVLKMLAEYKQIIYKVVRDNWDVNKFTPEQNQEIKQMAPTYFQVFEPEVCEALLHDVLMINKYAQLFEIDLDRDLTCCNK